MVLSQMRPYRTHPSSTRVGNTSVTATFEPMEFVRGIVRKHAGGLLSQPSQDFTMVVAIWLELLEAMALYMKRSSDVSYNDDNLSLREDAIEGILWFRSMYLHFSYWVEIADDDWAPRPYPPVGAIIDVWQSFGLRPMCAVMSAGAIALLVHLLARARSGNA